jgi:hypothetical protein
MKYFGAAIVILALLYPSASFAPPAKDVALKFSWSLEVVYPDGAKKRVDISRRKGVIRMDEGGWRCVFKVMGPIARDNMSHEAVTLQCRRGDSVVISSTSCSKNLKTGMEMTGSGNLGLSSTGSAKTKHLVYLSCE